MDYCFGNILLGRIAVFLSGTEQVGDCYTQVVIVVGEVLYHVKSFNAFEFADVVFRDARPSTGRLDGILGVHWSKFFFPASQVLYLAIAAASFSLLG